MTKQVKKGSGQPKAQEISVEETTVQAPVMEAPVKPTVPVKKRRTIKRTETLLTNAEYEIPKSAGIVFMLPQKGITVYDSEMDTVREMRYCPNEPSIWADEQGDKARKETVAFREGKHPMNMSNGGTIFREVNKKKDAEVLLKREFELSEAISLVRDKDINELLPVALYFGININVPVSEIRYNLLNVAKSKTQAFIESFDSPQVQVRSSIQQAKDYQILNLKSNGCYWFDSNSLIVSVPVGQDPLDTMVRFCLTEKGSSVLSLVESKLDKLG